jgi:hypothetical protein
MVKNVTTNGKLLSKKFTEMELLLLLFSIIIRFTGDYSYIPEKGLEVLIGIARFWHQRANFSTGQKSIRDSWSYWSKRI